MTRFTEILKHYFTARDGISYSLTKLFGAVSIAGMTWNFVALQSKDFNGFGMGVAAILGALAAKYFVEGGEPK